ncbi:UDP-glycosyltransferase 74B1-like [Pyrus ussuriensis x Pyrus communis]|uniref:UDP-glycosyltransferase 74B1-like n=1 Tax=Pyrus ussuriensis x Pyrus communis TaxID=2448454 RepID=A0A5N5HCN1_9ROSA|nr:UDP-glycosyltransferase 74B1-like [Pyrus ussuriensis x Pyrus communis]
MERRVHVVVLPYPSQGHINPLLQFAKRLASKGVKATLATTTYTLNSIRVQNVGVEPISDGFDEAGFAQAADEDTFLQSFKTNGSRTLSQLLQKYESSDFPVSCIVCDSFLPWALEVAKKHGVYGASFFTNSATVCVIFSYIYRGLISLPCKLEDMPLLFPGLPPLNLPDLPSFLKKPDSHPAYLKMKLNQYPNLDKADWIFANTFEALEGEAARGISELWPVKLIGPMVPSAYLDGKIKGDRGYGASLWKPLSEECTRWLEAKLPKSVVYVSFGSMVSLTPKQMEKGLVCDIVQPSTGTWSSWVLCDSLRGEFDSLGVPMAAVPQWADQLFVEEIWEVGVRAKEDEEGVMRKEAFVGCLKEVMEEERSKDIKKNSSKWREMAKKELSEGGSSIKSIGDFVEHLRLANKKGEAKEFMNGTD